MNNFFNTVKNNLRNVSVSFCPFNGSSNVVMGLEPHKGEQMMKFLFWSELYFLRQLSQMLEAGDSTLKMYISVLKITT